MGYATSSLALPFIALLCSGAALKGPNVCLLPLEGKYGVLEEIPKGEELKIEGGRVLEVCCRGFSEGPFGTCLPICSRPCPRGTTCIAPNQCVASEKCGAVHEGHSCVKGESGCADGTLKRGEDLCQGAGAACCLPRTSKVKRAVALPPGTKSAQKCIEYSKYVFEEEESPVPLPGETNYMVDKCGRVSQTLVVGGVNAEEREFPHMALIGHDRNGKVHWHCGGSLISEQFILSAAHCAQPVIKNVGRKQAKWALLGDLIVNSNEDEGSSQPVQVEIEQHFIPRDYHVNQTYHDIVLFKLKRRLTLNPFMRPICLHTTEHVPSRTALATGWGVTNITTGAVSPHLQKVLVDFSSYTVCEDTYKLRKKFPNGVNRRVQICAGSPGRDTCQGDSGGPLQINLEAPYCMQAVVGITSYGRECGIGHPAVYTKVSHYIPWIESIVWP